MPSHPHGGQKSEVSPPTRDFRPPPSPPLSAFQSLRSHFPLFPAISFFYVQPVTIRRPRTRFLHHRLPRFSGPPPSSIRNPPSSPNAFTLLELLVVMGIIGLLLLAIIPAVTSLTKSNSLNTAGRMLSNVLTIARSEAINRRALVRFEVATAWPGNTEAPYRKFTLVQHDVTSGTDTQLTKWETLPAGIIFNPHDPNPGSGSYLFVLNQVQNPALTSGGQPIPTVYVEFLPTGALNVQASNSPVRMRLVQGFLASASATSVTSSGTGNWFETSIDSLVGRIKISRP